MEITESELNERWYILKNDPASEVSKAEVLILIDDLRKLLKENARLERRHKADLISEKHLNCIIDELRILNEND